jgi:hypothetical protein
MPDMASPLSSTVKKGWRILYFPQMPPIHLVDDFALRWEYFHGTHVFSQILVLEPLQRVPPTAHRAAIFPRDDHAAS